MNTQTVLQLLQSVQENISAALEAEEGEPRFLSDEWQSKLGTGKSKK